MKNLLKTLAALGVFFAVAVIGLTVMRNMSRKPSIILSNTECAPPCWAGIQPGQMNSAEVLGILNNLNGVNQESIIPQYDKDDNLIRIFWYFQRPVEDGTGTVFFDDDQVTAISILTQNSLNLVELFGKLGEPEQYWKEVSLGQDRKYLDVVLLYPANGYAANVVLDIDQGARQVEITDTTPVLRVTFFAPDKFQDLMQTRTIIDKAAIARKGSLAPWAGFGMIPIDAE
jgi:hypothetical protein